MNHRELFELTGNNDTPIDVMNISSIAGDNAADTVGWDRRYGPDGRHTDEFIDMWYESVRSILCDYDTPELARVWFEAHGVRY